MKKHISKIMIVFSILFFIWGVIVFVSSVNVDTFFSFSTNEERLNIILLFSSGGLFLGIYRIIDLLERR